jgi:hypothetical protein
MNEVIIQIYRSDTVQHAKKIYSKTGLKASTYSLSKSSSTLDPRVHSTPGIRALVLLDIKSCSTLGFGVVVLLFKY